MKIVAVTSCPTGIAHTYMAAEALEMAAKELGYEIKVETQGAIGIENVLTEIDIVSSDIIILATDKEIDKNRFEKRVYHQVSTSDVIKDAKGVILDAIKKKEICKEQNNDKIYNKIKILAGIAFKYFITGISVMVPFLIAGAILDSIAALPLGSSFGDWNKVSRAILTISERAFELSLPVLSAYIAYSIGNLPALAPGMISGCLVYYQSGGFLGAIIVGFLAGYITKYLILLIKLPKSIEGLRAVFLIPALSSLFVGTIYTLAFSSKIYYINRFFIDNLNYNRSIVGIIGVALLSIMISYDMGGPINKLAYAFGIAAVTSGEKSTVMAAIVGAGMIPPLSIGLATVILKNDYTLEERKLGKVALMKGLAFITEGVIPFLEKDSKAILKAVRAGAVVTGVTSMIFGCRTLAPQGGIFMLILPGLIERPLLYLVSIILGTLTGTLIIVIFKLRNRKNNNETLILEDTSI